MPPRQEEKFEIPDPQLAGTKTIKESVQEVIFSEPLRQALEQVEGHAEYYRLLKGYQRCICLLKDETFARLTEEDQPMKVAFYIGLALIKLQ